jgi:hypothetical protein
MDLISNADRLVRLLRQKLEQRSNAKSAQSSSAPITEYARGINATKAITGQYARAGGREDALRRTLVEQLLADQFGTELVNEPKFQQVVDKVTDAMVADPDVADILGQVVTELKRMPG